LYILPLKFLHRGKSSDFVHRLEKEAELIAWDDLKSHIDFMYIAVHGRYAEDGTLQGMLEVLGIPYLGSKVFASACGIDKIFQKKLLQDHGVSVPKSFSLDDITFPVIVKPALEGSSVGISVVFEEKDIESAIEKAKFRDVTQEQPVLIEEKIEGMEFTCIGLVDKDKKSFTVLPITEVIPEEGTFFHDYEQKYMPGRSTKVTPARCSEIETKKIQDTCVKVAKILGFSTFFRIDGFLTESKEVVIVDPNTLSGMGPASFLFHQAAEIGMNHTDLINYLIDQELEQYGIKEEGRTVLGSADNKKREKKRVVVLLGGDSNEREISLESGRNVCYKLSPSKYDVIPVFVDSKTADGFNPLNLYKLSPRLLIQNSTREISELVNPHMQIKWSDLPNICDFVFIALHGGAGEDGSVQGALEMLKIPYNGSGILVSSLCMDKYKTNRLLEKNGFEVPKSFLLEKGDKVPTGLVFPSTGGFNPLIVKPHDDGCSTYVKKVTSEQELEKVLQEYFATEKTVAMIEECVGGMELTCGVIGNDDVTVFPPSQAVTSGDILSIEEKFLPGAGENQTPAPLPPEAISLVQDVIKNVYKTIGCTGYSRIDCFYDDGHVVILEVNSLPGLTPATCLFHQAAEIGIKPMELIDKIVELGLEKHKALTACAINLYKSSAGKEA
ncbi:MAG: ATP-grasp domain-containing protein, partial [Actinobacteria bacterium]|nr:ATP-grasp domain-containing protein [Actinomycetota bacterium]